MNRTPDIASLNDLLDGRLDPAAAEAVRRRIDEDPEFRAAWDDLNRLRAALRALPAPVVPEGFAEAVRTRIEREPAETDDAAGDGAAGGGSESRPVPVLRPHFGRPWFYAAAAVLGVAFGAGTWLWATHGGGASESLAAREAAGADKAPLHDGFRGRGPARGDAEEAGADAGRRLRTTDERRGVDEKRAAEAAARAEVEDARKAADDESAKETEASGGGGAGGTPVGRFGAPGGAVPPGLREPADPVPPGATPPSPTPAPAPTTPLGPDPVPDASPPEPVPTAPPPSPAPPAPVPPSGPPPATAEPSPQPSGLGARGGGRAKPQGAPVPEAAFAGADAVYVLTATAVDTARADLSAILYCDPGAPVDRTTGLTNLWEGTFGLNLRRATRLDPVGGPILGSFLVTVTPEQEARLRSIEGGALDALDALEAAAKKDASNRAGANLRAKAEGGGAAVEGKSREEPPTGGTGGTGATDPANEKTEADDAKDAAKGKSDGDGDGAAAGPAGAARAAMDRPRAENGDRDPAAAKPAAPAETPAPPPTTTPTTPTDPTRPGAKAVRRVRVLVVGP